MTFDHTPPGYVDPHLRLSSGRLLRLQDFQPTGLDPRPVDVWLPDGYDPARQYAVLYMHDGQMLFDAATTWNGQAWGVDAALTRLAAAGAIRDTIVVGVWNNGDYRHAEYYPQKILPAIPEPTRSVIISHQLNSRPQADAYLKFLVEELKPRIDHDFSTRPERENTFIMGSSMGGLISIYALCEYPQVFGGAAGLSTHTPVSVSDLINAYTDAEVASRFRDYLHTHLPPAGTCKLYMDYGDQTLDSLYAPFQTAIDAVLRGRGYTAPSWETRFFPGEDHTENAWSRRLEVPLRFLLGRAGDKP